MKMRGKQLGAETTDINISPLIDMVFILLIFFIVTTVFVEERGLQVDAPTPRPVDSDGNPLSLRLTDSGRVYLNGDEIPPGTVLDELRPQRSAGKRPGITLQVEPKVAIRAASFVVDQCRAAGFESVTLKSVDSD